MDKRNQEDQQGKGLVFIISAPSGTGKTTLVKRVMEELPCLRFSVSYTTRPPRLSEKEGVDYHFISREIFQGMVKKGQFLEWAEVLGHYYGTALVDPGSLESEGMDLILDIDTQGAKKAKEKLAKAILIFLLPPSIETLKERLLGRGLDSPETIQFRLAHAQKDIEEAHWYHHIVINERIEEAVEKLKAIIIAERGKRDF
ncbi:MAG: guanylate kinase [Deltaproteobacteria bacterium]|nr:guanylate kinase [Deltaproteobacteria bacterium]MBM4323409.1 guanylate kinase [Deltaproteobacteria bacterium]